MDLLSYIVLFEEGGIMGAICYGLVGGLCGFFRQYYMCGFKGSVLS
jgi:hypothetical protein